MTKTITDYVNDATRIAREHGWGWTPLERDQAHAGDDIHRLLSDLALVHSEVSEAVEAARDSVLGMVHEDKPEGLVVELADVVIRIMHLCGELGLPLEDAIIAKMAFNESRSFKHGGRKA